MADPLSETLALVNARCVISGGWRGGGAWSLRFPQPNRLKVNVVVRGSYWLVVDGVPPAFMQAGDVAVFNGRSPIVVSTDLELEPQDATDLFGETERIVQIGTGEDSMSIGGHIDVGTSGDLLVQALPPLIHVRAAAEQAGVLGMLIDQLVREMSDELVGAGFAADQLAQLMLLQVLRAYLDQAAALPAGWLRALADERIAPALQLIHKEPGRDWRLAELARSVAMSRSTFAERFRSAAGVPPLTYLLNWRMRLAQRALREQDMPLSALARSLGYMSESAFSNAFKRTVGVAPKRYRDTAKAGG